MAMASNENGHGIDVQAYMDTLSTEQALALACQGIQHAVGKTSIAESMGQPQPTRDSDSQSLPRIVALSLPRQQQESQANGKAAAVQQLDVKWYGQKDLLAFLTNEDRVTGSASANLSIDQDANDKTNSSKD